MSTGAEPCRCPSCRAPMAAHAFAAKTAATVELDLCFDCHGLWFDPQENLQLTPAGITELFHLLHAHRDTRTRSLATNLQCPRCDGVLTRGFDVVRSGRYLTYRCSGGHGRFSTFSSFMIEKGFVRLLTPAEIHDIAQRVAVIHCSSCGAPVDLRKDHACGHCRAALSLLDPKAVERALHGYEQAAKAPESAQPANVDVADALVMIERDRQRALREEGQLTRRQAHGRQAPDVDLWELGITLVQRFLG